MPVRPMVTAATPARALVLAVTANRKSTTIQKTTMRATPRPVPMIYGIYRLAKRN